MSTKTSSLFLFAGPANTPTRVRGHPRVLLRKKSNMRSRETTRVSNHVLELAAESVLHDTSTTTTSNNTEKAVEIHWEWLFLAVYPSPVVVSTVVL